MDNNVRIFERKLYEKMLDWKTAKNGKSALLIKGARRVGKSTLAEEFAKNEYESYIKVDFANAKKAVWEAVDNIADLDDFFLKLQFIYNVNLVERKSVIIFDEIQNAPKVRQAIKYLVQDHRYDYIETGSLLSIKRNTQGITIPSEETRITLYPMDYEEFRWALGDNVTIPLMKKYFDTKKSIGDQTNRELLRNFRLYMLIGGMPQAVCAYLDTNNLSMVDSVKRDIIELYVDDFRKIDRTGKAGRLFKSIPSELAKNASRYQTVSVLGRTTDKKEMDELLADMEDSMTIMMAYHADNPSVGLPLHTNKDTYKMFVCDTGLFVTLAFWDKSTTDNIIYQKLLSDTLSADLGYVYENVVAQMLKVSGYELFYHTWPTESGKHKYEIDFLLSKANKLCPIEVKSSSYANHKSLDEFCKKYSNWVSERFLIYTKDLRHDGQTTMIPAYMVPFLGCKGTNIF